MFNKDKDLTVNEWVEVEKEMPNTSHDIFKVKLSPQEECVAYYCYDLNPKWTHKQTKEGIKNVTHWGR